MMKNDVSPISIQRILGIDPGLRVTGFGVIEQQGKNLRYVASGVIRSKDTDSLPARIHTLFSGISEVVATYRPTHASIEIVFVNVNPQSTLLLGQARGAALAALTAASLPVAEYTALKIKQTVVGHGKAAKQQVGFMVTRLLGLEGAPGSDAADALACAITHAQIGSPGQQKSALEGTRRIRAGRWI